MSRKSRTCLGKATQKPLTEYSTEEEADSGATFAFQKFGTRMVPYQCQTCCLWHLAPPNQQRSRDPKHQHQVPQTAHRQSKSCYGKLSGKILTEYDTESDAKAAASYVLERHGQSMVPYKCQDCRFFHLSPVDRQTEHSRASCSCVDEIGSPKDGYHSKEDARRRGEILLRETGRKLNVYRCPEVKDCWHLTKKDPKNYEPKASTSRKSSTCRSKTGDFRTEFDTEASAANGAEHVLERYGKHLSPYKCATCSKFHIG
mmetsp:Transcript_6924/g.10953  ORF Transcript_6924/g.10953 Transcript_6924/m.10953 type:complete len:258 (+) Transcript_6924:294-1067(+)